jgi:nucleotide-binding universal stress UspA family protein
MVERRSVTNFRRGADHRDGQVARGQPGPVERQHALGSRGTARPFGLMSLLIRNGRESRRLSPVQHGEFELGTDGPSVILVGVDDSVTGLRAGAYAAGLARRQEARLIAVYVVPITSPVLTSAAGAGVLAAEREAHQAIAEELAGQADERARLLGISITFITAHGNPYHEITRIADETRADALVVGASLQAGHRLMGSLAVHLVRAGKWPVTVVP